jgi:hypothetical protein
VEQLEDRCLLSGGATATPAFGFGGGGLLGGGPVSGGGPSIVTIGNQTQPQGYSPAQIASFYQFGSYANGGANTTIAIVDAYNDPNIQNDLATFDMAEHVTGLGTLTVVNQKGQASPLPVADPTGGWELEESLDVEWAHAMAPNANILLVVANSNSTSDLSTAVMAANSYSNPTAPVVAVSMSWGGGAPSNVSNLFSTPGITYFAASGDSGPGAEWPASSPNVVGVGGTSININNGPTSSSSETAWNGSGGGPASGTTEPTYQSSYQTATGNAVLNGATTRGTPDVSYVADPNTGVAVYDSYAWTVSSGFGRRSSTTTEVYDWIQIGGTSVGTPQWAAIAADADSALGTGHSLGAQFLTDIYGYASNSNSYTSDFTDITSGSSSSGSFFRHTTLYAGSGYDYVTGLGSPKVSSLIGSLTGVATGQAVTLTGGSANTGTTGGVLTPHDITFTPVTIIIIQPAPPTASPTPAPASNSTPAPPSASSTSTPSGTVVLNTLPFAALLNSGSSAVVISVQNPFGLSSTASAAATHAAVSSGAESGAAASTSLVPTSNAPVLPPQPLYRAPASDRGPAAPRFFEPEPVHLPDLDTPVLGWELVSRGAPARGLDLIAIANQAAALGRVADQGDAGARPPLAPPPAAVPDDMNRRDQSGPLDPALAGVVVTVTGALAVQVNRADARARRRSRFPQGPVR